MGLPGEEAAAAPSVSAPFLCVLRVPAAHRFPDTFHSSIFQQENARLQPGRRWCKSIRGCQFFLTGTASIKVMPAALNGKNGEHYRGGLPVLHASVAQVAEHRASNAEVAGEGSAGSVKVSPA
jgi:hypothetical protein